MGQFNWCGLKEPGEVSVIISFERMELSYINALKAEKGGFNFDNLCRNEMIMKAGASTIPLKIKKTGTTICGVVVKDGIILGADTRSTSGYVVADKYCIKLHKLADNIWAAGAGTAADLMHITSLYYSKFQLENLMTGRQCRVASVVTQLKQMLYRYQGHIQTALVLGGVDCTGPHLHYLFPDGCLQSSSFAAMGSGQLDAMATLEAGYKDGMTMEEGKALMTRAIKAGIYNDLGSGGNFDLLTINKEGVAECIRGSEQLNARLYRTPKPVDFPAGTTPVVSRKIQELKSRVIVESSDVIMRG